MHAAHALTGFPLRWEVKECTAVVQLDSLMTVDVKLRGKNMPIIMLLQY